MKHDSASTFQRTSGTGMGITSKNKKPVVIGLITGGAIIVLLLFLFFGTKFVGKAIYVDIANPSISVDGVIEAGSSVTLVLQASISGTMTGATFQLTSSDLDICDSTITDLFGGLLSGSAGSYTCSGGVLTFDDGFLSGSESGPTVDLVQITLTPAAVPFDLEFTQFEIVDKVNEYASASSSALTFLCPSSDCTSGDAGPAPEPTPASVVCGDDKIEGTEECEGSDFGSKSCTSLGFDGGSLSCDASCIIDSSACTSTVEEPGPESSCGDGTIDAGEECDGTNLNGNDCMAQGFDEGTLSCTSSCGFNTAGCTSDTGGGEIIAVACGDRSLDSGEACDDGNTANGDGCSSLCEVEDSPAEDLCVGIECGVYGSCTAATGICDCTDGYTGEFCDVAPIGGEETVTGTLLLGASCSSTAVCSEGECILSECRDVDGLLERIGVILRSETTGLLSKLSKVSAIAAEFRDFFA